MPAKKDHAPSSTLTTWLLLFLLMPGLAGLSYLLTLIGLGSAPPGLANPAVSPIAPAATTTAPAATAVSPTITPDPAAMAEASFPFPSGSRRSDPYPMGSIAELEFWQVRLTDHVLRGEAAWQWLIEANTFNDPPPAGWEYLLLRLHISNQHTGVDQVNLGVHVTGDSNVVHFGFDSGVVPPSPSLETYLSPGGESEGWDTFRIRQGESNLMLVLEDLSNYEEDEVYLALEPEAAITIPAESLNTISPTNVGETTAAPALPGETVTGADWQATITEVRRGASVWERLQEVNFYNDPAPEGMEYLLIYARVRYIGADHGPLSITRRSFELLQEDGEEYEYPSVVHPEPELFVELFPGGEGEGWMVMQVETDHEAPLLRFNPSPYGENATANQRFFVLSEAE